MPVGPSYRGAHARVKFRMFARATHVVACVSAVVAKRVACLGLTGVALSRHPLPAALRQAIADAKAIPALVAVMGGHRGVADVQQYCARVLSNLAVDSGLCFDCGWRAWW